jgi:hypothetical protein
MDPALSRRLRRLWNALAEVPEGVATELLARLRDRLDRDLLPRTAARDGALVVGIVGPNNAGKSALFNALVGRDLSPSLPTGGATRRLVGAAHPQLAAELRARTDWSRFEATPFDGSAPEQALSLAARPSELLLAESDRLAPDLLLIDTPDFDSVARENRAASEALLAVADLALVIVTRHTYQNAELVAYLRTWLGSGRPWMLVYNEAPSPSVAAEHAQKLAADVGHAPLSVFAAPTDLEVMAGRARLDPRAVDGDRSLAAALADASTLRALKGQALAASLGQVQAEVQELATALERRAADAARVHAHAAQAARDLGFAVAAEAMPAGPFLAAFRAVLDRRSNRWSRRWRSALGNLRVRLEGLPRAFRGAPRGDPEAQARSGLHQVEGRALERAWPGFFEGLARDLGTEGRSAVRARCPQALAARLDRDLARGGAEGLERAQRALLELPLDFEQFQGECERLVEEALEQRGTDLDIQVAADLATVLPVAIAAAVIVKTGGFGADLGLAGSGVVTTFLFDKYKHLLGSRITREARRGWERQRGGRLGDVAYRSALPTAGEPLERAAHGDLELARTLRQWRDESAEPAETSEDRSAADPSSEEPQ